MSIGIPNLYTADYLTVGFSRYCVFDNLSSFVKTGSSSIATILRENRLEYLRQYQYHNIDWLLEAVTKDMRRRRINIFS